MTTENTASLDEMTTCPFCHADGSPTGRNATAIEYQCGNCHHTYTRPANAEAIDAGKPELVVDRALRQALESLTTAARLATTSSGDRAERVMGEQFDRAFMAVETLIELRAGENARTAARFGVTGPTIRANE
jgi:ribosomal protein L37AE/L43A